MNARLEKLCLPRYQRDPIFKFWQPNAKLEKIHPPIFWKGFDAKQIDSKVEISRNNQKSPPERSCSDACYYTTLIDKEYRIYVDYEHEDIQHAMWKESIDDQSRSIQREKSIYLQMNMTKEKDSMREINDFKRSKSEILTRQFYHRKYFLPRCLREHTLKNLVKISKNGQIEIEILGHFILHPNELSKNEIEMFELTSDFGDIYEGHILRINSDKLIMLLSSTDHSYIKLSSSNHIPNMIDKPVGVFEEFILEHVRKYLQTNANESVDDIRRIEIEIEPKTDSAQHRVKVYLLSDEDCIDELSFEIPLNEDFQSNLQFLQGINEKSMIESIEDKLQQSSSDDFSWDFETIDAMQEMFNVYAKKSLSNYGREQCIRLGVEYNFDDILEKLDSEEIEIDEKLIEQIQQRLKSQMQRRLMAETTAQVLLAGPIKKKKIEFADKQVIVLDHYRTIFITKSDESVKMKDTQCRPNQIMYHEETNGGPRRFDRLSMAIDSLTILARRQQRKRLAMEDDEAESQIELGSGIRQLQTNENEQQSQRFVFECEQNQSSSRSLSTDDLSHTIDTKSYNKSAQIEQQNLKYRGNHRIKRRRNRSPAHYEKHRLNHKQHFQSVTKTSENSKRPVFFHPYGINSNALSKDSNTSVSVDEIYQSESSQLIASLDLAHIFINFLHLQKDVANEMATEIITARQRLVSQISIDDRASISSEILLEDEEDVVSELIQKQKSNPRFIMGRITSYLSTVDWRVFFHITKHFLQNDGIVTRHALEFSSALTMDLIEDSVYRTYFQLRWCSNNKKIEDYIENIMIEDLLKKSVDRLRNHLQLIDLPLLENITLIQILKKYSGNDLAEEIHSMYRYPTPTDRDPCIWFSIDILIKIISSLTNDILNRVNDHHLLDYAKLENILISYFRKIEIITKQNQLTMDSENRKSLLHLIDLNQAPKFISGQAFKRFHLNKHNDNIQTFKDLFLEEVSKKNIEREKPPYVPLNMNDLVVREKHRVIRPSSWIIAKYHGRWKGQRSHLNKENLGEHSYQLDELMDSTNRDDLPDDVRNLLDDIIKNYGAEDENSTLTSSAEEQRRQQENLTEEDLARLIENAIDAVGKFDVVHNIDHRDLRNKKTDNDRLAEFFKYAGRHGVRLLDDVLDEAKQRSNDPKIYIPLAVDLLKERLKRGGASQISKDDDRFGHILESLLAATNDEPELIKTILKKKSTIKKKPTIDSSIEHEVHRTTSSTIRQTTGLTVAQLIVLISQNNEIPLKLTETQIEQICEKQSVSKAEIKAYVNKAKKSNEINTKFVLTEQQLVQIALEENISLTEVETTKNRFRLNETQIQSLINYLNANNCTSNQHELALMLNLDQFIELCYRQQIDINTLIENQNLTKNSQEKFSLTSMQIADLIQRNNFDGNKLKIIEKQLKAQHFYLNPSQLAYLFVNCRSTHNVKTEGLSVSQLIALHMLQQSTHFSLTYDQIKYIALQQNMSLEHFQSLTSWQKPFELTDDQLIYIAQENQIPIESIHRDKKSIILNQEQLCSLIQQHRCLNVEQIFFLAKSSSLTLDQLVTCATQNSKSSVPSKFTLSDDQFRSLLHSNSASKTTLISQASADIQIQLPSSLAELLAAAHKRLQSSVQSHAQTTEIISNSMLERNQIKDLIRQSSLHAANDITIPSFVIDLLKTSPITEEIYKSIEQSDEVKDNNLSEEVIERIRTRELTYPQIQRIQTTFLTPTLVNEFKSNRLSPQILDAYKSLSSLQTVNKIRSSITQSNPIVIYPESSILRQQMLDELRTCVNTQLVELKNEYNIEPIKGQASIQQITAKLRTMEITKNLELLIDRQIDEIDVLNILEGHANHFLIHTKVETDLVERNSQLRSNRINERIQLVHLLQNHIETERLKRPLTSNELSALVLEDIPQFEQITNVHLTEDDLRIISMNRFASLEQSLTRQLTESEYRHLLQTNSPIDYIEQEILKRPLTKEERVEQDELKVKSTTETLQQRAELVDNYEILHSITPTIIRIENELKRSLTIDEKKRLVQDDYSMIQFDRSSREILPTTIVEQTQDKNISENITKIDDNLEKPIESLHKNRSTDKELRDVLSEHEHENDTEKELDHPLVTEHDRSFYIKAADVFDQPTSPLVDNTVEKLEDISERSIQSAEKEIEQLERNVSSSKTEEISPILQRRSTHDELTDKELDQQKENEIKQLPIYRIRYFEKIFNRRLSTNELLRFADDRFEPLSRLLSDVMKSEQILDLSAGRYDKIERFFQRPLTPKEKYDLNKSILQAHLKYSNDLAELEYIIQRRLTENELRTLADGKFGRIEKHLGKLLTEKQLRNLLQGKDDPSLIEVDDLVKSWQRKYQDDSQRTQRIVTKLLEQLDREYHEQEKDNQKTETKPVKPSTPRSSLHETQSNMKFEEITSDLLEQLSEDVRKHAVVKTPDDKSDIISKEEEEEGQSISDKEITPNSITSLPTRETDSIKAFESPTRIVEQISDKERIEEITSVNNLIEQFLAEVDKPFVKKPSSSSLPWLFKRNEPIDDRPSIPNVRRSIETHSKEDIFLGWSLFKSIDRPELGFKQEKPRMVKVKHIAQTYVVGIPEEYADSRSKIIANKLYRGETIRYTSSKSQIIKEMNEFISETIRLPIINDATHFIVPSRAYMDLIQPIVTHESELIEIEDNDLQMRESFETIEWYEECIQRNIQVHAQIPIGSQSSIVYCHTGRRTIMTPMNRTEQRKISKSARKQTDNSSTFHVGLMERISQPMFANQSIEPPSIARTVTDLIMHTVTTSKKTDLLEALDDLFSDENLDKYQMTETHWQDIFLILLNSYLRSNSINRKEIFQRLTDKLHELRNKDYARASFNDEIIKENQPAPFHFGLRSPSNSLQSGQTLNESEYSLTPTTADRQSLVSHESLVLPSIKNLSNQSLPHNQSSIEEKKTMTRYSIPIASRKYKITVMHSDDPSETESLKLPSIVPKKTLPKKS